MILIPSCAAYSDCWQPWLQFYRKHWKAGYYHRIVLATDFAAPERQQGFDHVLELELEAMTGKYYPTPAWTTRLHDALKFTDAEQFILCCEDHWPLPPADWKAVEIARNLVTDGPADCVRLAPCPGAPESQIGPFGPVPDGTPYRISCGPTIWNTARLREFLEYLQHVLPLPTAHHYENFGSPASARYGLSVWATTEAHCQLPFLNSAVTGGKWSQNALLLAKELGVDVDRSNREIAT